MQTATTLANVIELQPSHSLASQPVGRSAHLNVWPADVRLTGSHVTGALVWTGRLQSILLGNSVVRNSGTGGDQLIRYSLLSLLVEGNVVAQPPAGLPVMAPESGLVGEGGKAARLANSIGLQLSRT